MDDRAEQLVLTPEASREVDRLAVEKYAIPSIVLMENASRGAADVALGMLRDAGPGPRVTIVCGPGNNGGDGLTCARHLHNAGARVQVVLLAEPEKYKGDAAVNLEIVRRMELPVEQASGQSPTHQEGGLPARDSGKIPEPQSERSQEGGLPARDSGKMPEPQSGNSGAPSPDLPDLLIDAIFGTGLDRPVEGRFADAIDRLNAAGALGVPVLALDIPSGLDATSGEPLGTAVRASATATFEALKPAMTRVEAQPYLGDVHVVPIGVPRELTASLASPRASQPRREGTERADASLTESRQPRPSS